ncbi:MAG: SCO family protein [Caulobacterales bacterium]|jgi:protein SCO1/2
MKWLAIAMSVALATACAPAVKTWGARGVVLEEDAAAGKVLIDHEDIKGLMPAMQMPFEAGPEILAQLETSDEISFTFEQRGSRFVITKIDAMRRPQMVAATPFDFGAAHKPAKFDFDLIDQSGKPVAMADFKGRVLIVNFIYTRCPGPCPAQTSQMAVMRRAMTPALRDKIAIVSITLDPDYDTPARLKAFAAQRGADWPFLGGAPEKVNAVKEGFRMESGPGKSQVIDHWVGVYVFDQRGSLIRRFSGLSEDMGQVADYAAQIAQAAPR